jgi:protoheme IX farnesyltransferase
VAAQLQARASPGEVVIASSTHRLAGRMFDCRALPAIEVKGLPQPVEAWQVWGDMAGVSRFEARRSGALPPLIGWAAAGRSNPGIGWSLFAIMFTWQMPHFFAIAWTYRKDYAAAGMPMLSVVDPSGAALSRWTFIWTTLLVAASLLPTLLGYCTWYYGAAAAVLGLWFLVSAFHFLNPAKRDTEARKLFFISIAYLPLLLGLLVADRMIFKL